MLFVFLSWQANETAVMFHRIISVHWAKPQDTKIKRNYPCHLNVPFSKLLVCVPVFRLAFTHAVQLLCTNDFDPEVLLHSKLNVFMHLLFESFKLPWSL